MAPAQKGAYKSTGVLTERRSAEYFMAKINRPIWKGREKLRSFYYEANADLCQHMEKEVSHNSAAGCEVKQDLIVILIASVQSCNNAIQQTPIYYCYSMKYSR